MFVESSETCSPYYCSSQPHRHQASIHLYCSWRWKRENFFRLLLPDRESELCCALGAVILPLFSWGGIAISFMKLVHED